MACPIDKHFPLELFEFKVYHGPKSRSKSVDSALVGLNSDSSVEADDIIIKEGLLFCSQCSRYFPIIDEIPIMLPDELRERKKDLQFLQNWHDEIPRKILDYGQPWHIDRKSG